MSYSFLECKQGKLPHHDLFNPASFMRETQGLTTRHPYLSKLPSAPGKLRNYGRFRAPGSTSSAHRASVKTCCVLWRLVPCIPKIPQYPANIWSFSLLIAPRGIPTSCT